MNTIVINTQAELDALPDSFAEYTQIKIHGGTIYAPISVTKKWKNSSIVDQQKTRIQSCERKI
jgi:hypothetical protein